MKASHNVFVQKFVGLQYRKLSIDEVQRTTNDRRFVTEEPAPKDGIEASVNREADTPKEQEARDTIFEMFRGNHAHEICLGDIRNLQTQIQEICISTLLGNAERIKPLENQCEEISLQMRHMLSRIFISELNREDPFHLKAFIRTLAAKEFSLEEVREVDIERLLVHSLGLLEERLKSSQKDEN